MAALCIDLGIRSTPQNICRRAITNGRDCCDRRGKSQFLRIGSGLHAHQDIQPVKLYLQSDPQHRNSLPCGLEKCLSLINLTLRSYASRAPLLDKIQKMRVCRNLTIGNTQPSLISPDLEISISSIACNTHPHARALRHSLIPGSFARASAPRRDPAPNWRRHEHRKHADRDYSLENSAPWGQSALHWTADKPRPAA